MNNQPFDPNAYSTNPGTPNPYINNGQPAPEQPKQPQEQPVPQQQVPNPQEQPVPEQQTPNPQQPPFGGSQFYNTPPTGGAPFNQGQPYQQPPVNNGQPYQQPYNYYQYYQQPAQQPAHGLALASLICALVGFFCCGFFTSIPAIICAIIAKKQGNTEGINTAGLILGIIATVLYVLIIIAYIIVIAAAISSGAWDHDMTLSFLPHLF